MKQGQTVSLALLVMLTFLAAVRSSAVQGFFSGSFAHIGANLTGQAASTPTSGDVLDWHLFLWWGVAALLVIGASSYFPGVVNAILGLIIMEELLVHWSSYTALLSPPTK